MAIMIKIILLFCCKYLGFFKISKYLYRKKLRILCYHDYGDSNAAAWRPGLVMTQHTFARRLGYLAKNGFTVLPLSDAMIRMKEESLPNSSIVITIDDGFASIKNLAHPLLFNNRFPYTVYITSYYCIKESPIFNLSLPYIFWKSCVKRITLNDKKTPFIGTIELNNGPVTGEFIVKIIDYGQNNLDHNGRMELLKYFSDKLDVNFEELRNSRIFNLLNKEEIRDLFESNLADFQLHTHRHKWPFNESDALEELEKNKEFLLPLVGYRFKHFCYPSGIWSYEQIHFLEKAGIESATTCESGFNDSTTNNFLLKRILDDEGKSQLEFESEVCGFKDIIKRIGILK
jgi:peptidoglycan/xylan/chitin deacetylase (PgdA/CDA1 family)